MFWTEDIQILLNPVLIPTDSMIFDEKLNTLTRLVIFVCMIASLLLQDSRILLFMIILITVIILVHSYDVSLKKNVKEEFLNVNDLDVIDSSICVKPTKNNPMMNPNLIDIIDYDQYNIDGACPIYNDKVKEEVDDIFDRSMFLNATDIYNTGSSKRQFYTVPVSKLPSDQTEFAKWLYDRGDTCKKTGDRCLSARYYKDLRM